MQDAAKTITIKGKSYSEALQAVKQRLGAEAVILTSRLIPAAKGEPEGRPWVELTAVAAEDASQLMRGLGPRAARSAGPRAETKASLAPESLEPLRRKLLEEEVKERLVDEIMTAVARRVVALGVAGARRAFDLFLQELLERVQVLSDARKRSRARLTCVVGPCGVGRSSLAASLAVHASSRGRERVAIVSLSKGGSREILKVASGVLECPMLEADTPAALVRVLSELVNVDQVFLDAPGCSPFDAAGISRLQQLLAVVPGVETHLLLSPLCRDNDLRRSIEAFSRLELTALAFSHLDEASCYGGILNAQKLAGLPLSWFMLGREIPADLEEASRERVLDLLLDLEAGEQQSQNG